MNHAAAKIQMMKASVRCLTFGLLALLPIIGVPFGLAALWISGQARVREKLYWNPARPYRMIGTVCAAVGTIVWCFILMLMIYRTAHGGGSGGEFSHYNGDE